MADYAIRKSGAAHICYTSLPSQANTKVFQVNPTIAAGDFKVSIDGGAYANLTTLPVVTPVGSATVKISLSAAEMTGDNIIVQCIDAAGAEWCDQLIPLPTAPRGIADLATQSSVDVIDDFLDTEVAAIKAKTDQLTFTTANVVDASPTSAALIRTAVGLASANLDTQLSAIAADCNIAEMAASQLLGVGGDVGDELRSFVGLAAADLDTQLDVILNSLAMQVRSLQDTQAISFNWHNGSDTITGLVSVNDGAFAAVTGAITFLRSEGDEFFYSLAYNSADCPTAEGTARYIFSSGGNHVHVKLRVESNITAEGVRTAVGLASANLDTQLGAIDNFLDTEIAALTTSVNDLPTNAELATAVGTVMTTAMTESYAADGSPPTPAQALFLIQQSLNEAAIISTTKTVKKLDGSTTAATFTLDSATAPTSITRAS